MWNLRSRGPTVKLYIEFLFHKVLAPLTLSTVQDSTILSSPTAMTCGFPGGTSGKEPACKESDMTELLSTHSLRLKLPLTLFF